MATLHAGEGSLGRNHPAHSRASQHCKRPRVCEAHVFSRRRVAGVRPGSCSSNEGRTGSKADFGKQVTPGVLLPLHLVRPYLLIFLY